MADFTRDITFKNGGAMFVLRHEATRCDFGLVGLNDQRAAIRLSPEELTEFARAALDCVQEMMAAGVIRDPSKPDIVIATEMPKLG